MAETGSGLLEEKEADNYERGELKERIELLREILVSVENISRSDLWRSENSRQRVARLSHAAVYLVDIVDDLVTDDCTQAQDDSEASTLTF